MIRLKEINGCTHWAHYDFIDGRWRRAAVYKLEGQSESGLLIYLRNLKTGGEHKRGVGYMVTDCFKPFAFDGGRKR